MPGYFNIAAYYNNFRVLAIATRALDVAHHVGRELVVEVEQPGRPLGLELDDVAAGRVGLAGDRNRDRRGQGAVVVRQDVLAGELRQRRRCEVDVHVDVVVQHLVDRVAEATGQRELVGQLVVRLNVEALVIVGILDVVRRDRAELQRVAARERRDVGAVQEDRRRAR